MLLLEEQQEMVRLYTEERWTLRKIADEFGCSHENVRLILKKHNVQPRSRGRKMERKTDKNRRVRPKVQGDPLQVQFNLTIPTWLIREITQTDDTEEAKRIMRSYEFSVTADKNGIHYTPHKISETEGW